MGYFLTIEGGALRLYSLRGNEAVTSLADLSKLTGGRDFMVSSSVDFPEEATSDPAVIALAKAIRAH